MEKLQYIEGAGFDHKKWRLFKKLNYLAVS